MSNDRMASWQESSWLSGNNADYLEGLYESYQKDPKTVPAEWRTFFEQLTADDPAKDISYADIRDQFRYAAKMAGRGAQGSMGLTCNGDARHVHKESAIAHLINDYRSYGHQLADLDPLKLLERKAVVELSLKSYGLNDSDLDNHFHAGNVLGLKNATLRETIEVLQTTYCGSIGVEYMHITEAKAVEWLQSKMEPVHNRPQFSAEQKQRILTKLVAAEGLEKYLGNRYVGQKRFSLEGGDSFIVAMDKIIQHCGAEGVRECIISMAHRGRLNVLMNTLGKKSSDLFDEFEGNFTDSDNIADDVKYHLGFSSNVVTEKGIVHLTLAFNPSHLEIAGPVVEGSVRSRQRRRRDKERVQVLPILVHGDAAMAGQGVVMELFNLSHARGYCTGGTLHIVINNQIGFTTSNPLDARSTLYCTDVAKMVQAPVFHVNCDDPEAVAFVSKLALDYRMRFHKDVVLDLVCYRRHGHNEADEPAATQPLMYKTIRKHPTTLALYSKQLLDEKTVTPAQAKKINDDYRSLLDRGCPLIETLIEPPDDLYSTDWSPYLENTDLNARVKTAVPLKRLKQLAKGMNALPTDFKVQAQVGKMLANRDKMTAGELPLNWGYAELLAYATLLTEGHPVRISGQDSGRGTFAHRHARLHNQVDAAVYAPLNHLNDEQAAFICIDSVLSEEAVMAFEYGYASTEPNALVIWEGQFGDFANGAQVVIDQFICSAEQKWNRFSGLVLFLPHGYEGMGPEHSSARLERYLQLCAQQNMSVTVPTTPAQIFHLLRLQMKRLARKPLIVMTPKSLLRHKLAVSTLNDLANGQFERVLAEIDKLSAKTVKRVVLCSGKVFYDLLLQRRDDKIKDVAIIRVEQLYPFPLEEVLAQLNHYPNAKEVTWCQEEPKNQGAWYQIQSYLLACTVEHGRKLDYAGRRAMAAPAEGSAKRHAAAQRTLVAKALK
ncbi:MAG: 2-oxoglutarate dehydrogenase E1 component [Gammaproteobacteria bacterium]|nr:2-oxoglutarate dehydrogenase E1 component [Gammaproteobacteria bacterium]